MSFSSNAKEELAGLSLGKRCCRRVETAAMVRMGGTIEILSGGKLGLRFDTESLEVARRMAALIRSLYHVQGQMTMREGRRLQKKNSFQLHIMEAGAAASVLEDAGIHLSGDWDPEAPQLPDGRIDRPCCKAAFLRGAFLAAGTISDPSGGYHLEIAARDEEMAQLIVRVLASHALRAHTAIRREQWVVYLKEGDQVVDFLGIIGAHEAVLAMENVRAEKSLRNQVNRQVNCENANLDKTVDAAGRQMEAIACLERIGALHRLSPALREAAELRMAYPEATLQELSEAAPGLSKSAMNHRLRKLVELANQYRKGEGES